MTVFTMIVKMYEGLGKTCAIFFLTLLFSLPLGVIIALLRIGRNGIFAKKPKKFGPIPIAVNKRGVVSCVLLSVFTLGIYSIYWKYLLVKNVRALNKDKSRCIVETLCFVLVPFYPLFWWITRGKAANEKFKEYGYSPTVNNVVCFILCAFGLEIVSMAFLQNEFNTFPCQSAKTSQRGIISRIVQFIVSVLRGTPLMLQLLAVTYGPYYLFGFSVSRNKLIPVVVAFSINYAAYFSEIYRGGIESIAAGQYEAAEVLGYSKLQTLIKIILPQVVKRILPSVTNEIVTLVKDTSIAFTVSYQEMFTIGKQIANSQTSFTPFLVAGVFYYVFNAIVGFVMGRAEKSLSYYK